MLKLKPLFISSDGIMRVLIISNAHPEGVPYTYAIDTAIAYKVGRMMPYSPGKALQILKSKCTQYMGPDGIIKKGGNVCQSTQPNTGTQGSTG